MKLGKKNRAIKILGIILAVIVILVAALYVGFRIYTSSYYASDFAVIDKIEARLEMEVESFSDEYGSVFIPERQRPKAVIAFYPGGKVEYSAYSSLMYELASRGYLCVLPKMPNNLAVMKIQAIEDMGKARPGEFEKTKDLSWYLAGHSLGGVAVSEYLGSVAGTDLDKFTGLILCASYTTEDLSSRNLRLLSVYGDRDGVMKMSAYEQSKKFWPSDSTEEVIEGGIHSYFGSYGIQDGDGEPAITNEEQLARTAQIIDSWISGGQ